MEDSPRGFSQGKRLVLLSFLMLFLELALIRWAGSEVVHLSYFTNFVLLGSFLGIGIGFLRSRSEFDLFRFVPIGLAVLVALVQFLAQGVPRGGVNLEYFGASPGRIDLPIWAVLPLVFVLVATVMAFVGQGVGKAFVRFEPLDAYRLDIVGSLLGAIAFSLLSFLGLPPVAWGAVVVALLLLLAFPSRRRLLWVLPGAVVILGVLWYQSVALDTYYSPYYKVQLSSMSEGRMNVTVNNKSSQFMATPRQLSKTHVTYLLPYGWVSPRTALIIGAGTGNDVAIALERGAERVDAVEVDPVLVAVGTALHPARPYQDPRTNAYVEDGRAFLERSEEEYDLVMYSLADSLTLIAGQGGTRLESYLFTEEAIHRAKEHLAPGGTFALYGYFPAPWMVDRMAALMESEFGRPTCIPAPKPLRPTKANGEVPPQFLVMLISEPSGDCQPTWEPGVEAVVAPPTDDRPFPYLRGFAIPSFYGWALMLVLAISLVSVRLAGGPLRRMARYGDLFFMGAAFLLLETKSVVQFALLFGTTWFVNALVFIGILLVVYGAVAVARRRPLARAGRLYPLLFGSLAVAWSVPPALLLGLPLPLRFVAAVVLAFTPVFLANLIFAERFRSVEASAVAFSANLLGAMCGGLLEYGALLTGYRFLIVASAFLYLCAYLVGRRHRRHETGATLPPAPDKDQMVPAG